MLNKIKKSKIAILTRKYIKHIAIFVIKTIMNLLNIDLLDYSLKKVGIGVNFKHENSGEKYFINKILKILIEKKEPILFDVGANIGTYSIILRDTFKNAKIYAFEPNPYTYNRLIETIPPNQNFLPINIALGDKEEECNIFFESNNETSPLSSLNINVYLDLHKNPQIKSVTTKVTTLDNYMEINKIQSIDFLKIDTEGYERNILIGARSAIKTNKIKIIQFEFNEMNIITRTFLKDFYELLPNYIFFRIRNNRIVPLGRYNPRNEIFVLQNIVAIHKDLIQKLKQNISYSIY